MTQPSPSTPPEIEHESTKTRKAMWRELRRGLAVPFVGGFVIGMLCLSITGLNFGTILGVSFGIAIICAITALALGGA